MAGSGKFYMAGSKKFGCGNLSANYYTQVFNAFDVAEGTQCLAEMKKRPAKL